MMMMMMMMMRMFTERLAPDYLIVWGKEEAAHQEAVERLHALHEGDEAKGEDEEAKFAKCQEFQKCSFANLSHFWEDWYNWGTILWINKQSLQQRCLTHENQKNVIKWQKQRPNIIRRGKLAVLALQKVPTSRFQAKFVNFFFFKKSVSGNLGNWLLRGWKFFFRWWPNARWKKALQSIRS